MTAYVLDGERERCLDAGMDDYLSKPVSTSRLGETLGRWINMPEPAVDPETLSGFKAAAKANPRFMSDITTLFREDALVRLHDLRDAAAAQDGDRLARAAHALKSSSGNVGAKRLYILCAAIEENARAGKIGDARELVDQLAGELDVAVAALTRSANEERA
jgi:HPt (histidine-containing phosphotransfer) domain-containing protein